MKNSPLSRRTFLKNTSLVAAGAAAQVSIEAPAFAQQDDLPNIIWLIADDIGPHEIGCYGHGGLKKSFTTWKWIRGNSAKSSTIPLIKTCWKGCVGSWIDGSRRPTTSHPPNRCPTNSIPKRGNAFDRRVGEYQVGRCGSNGRYWSPTWTAKRPPSASTILQRLWKVILLRLPERMS